MTTTANFKMTRPTNDVLEAQSTSSLDFNLGADLMPTSFQLKVEQEVLRAEGSLSELAGHRIVLAGNVTPTEIKRSFRNNSFRETNCWEN